MEKKEFKIGDRVKIVGYTTGSNKTGDVGIIQGFNHDMTYARIDTGQGRLLSNCYTFVSELVYEPLEEIFIFPEKWYIRAKTDNECIIISKWCNDNPIDKESTYNKLPLSRKIYSEQINRFPFKRADHHSRETPLLGFTEITFEQFLENVVNVKKEKTFEPLPFYKVLEVHNKNQDMLYVQNNEGNVFRLGDIVIGLTATSKLWGEMKITSFRKTVNTDNICAITSKTSKFGIGIDKIQHVVKQPVNLLKLAMEQCDKVQPEFDKRVQEHLEKTETILEKAIRLYPVGTNFIAARGNARNTYTVYNDDVFKENNGAICIRMFGNGTIYFNGKWAEKF